MRPRALRLAPALSAGTLLRIWRCAGAAESSVGDIARWRLSPSRMHAVAVGQPQVCICFGSWEKQHGGALWKKGRLQLWCAASCGGLTWRVRRWCRMAGRRGDPTRPRSARGGGPREAASPPAAAQCSRQSRTASARWRPGQCRAASAREKPHHSRTARYTSTLPVPCILHAICCHEIVSAQ